MYAIRTHTRGPLDPKSFAFSPSFRRRRRRKAKVMNDRESRSLAGAEPTTGDLSDDQPIAEHFPREKKASSVVGRRIGVSRRDHGMGSRGDDNAANDDDDRKDRKLSTVVQWAIGDQPARDHSGPIRPEGNAKRVGLRVLFRGFNEPRHSREDGSKAHGAFSSCGE